MLKPVVDFFLNPWNAPIWIALAALTFAGAWLYERRETVAPALRRRVAGILPTSVAPTAAPAAAAAAAPLPTNDIALIERVLDACDEQLVSPEPVGLDDPRAMLRSALSGYLRGDDPRGRRVATLLADRHTHEAQDLAVAIAAELKPAAAAQAWLDASAVSVLNGRRRRRPRAFSRAGRSKRDG